MKTSTCAGEGRLAHGRPDIPGHRQITAGQDALVNTGIHVVIRFIGRFRAAVADQSASQRNAIGRAATVGVDAVFLDRIVDCGRSGDGHTRIGIASNDIRSPSNRATDGIIGAADKLDAIIVGNCRRTQRVDTYRIALDEDVGRIEIDAAKARSVDNVPRFAYRSADCTVRGTRTKEDSAGPIPQSTLEPPLELVPI